MPDDLGEEGDGLSGVVRSIRSIGTTDKNGYFMGGFMLPTRFLRSGLCRRAVQLTLLAALRWGMCVDLTVSSSALAISPRISSPASSIFPRSPDRPTTPAKRLDISTAGAGGRLEQGSNLHRHSPDDCVILPTSRWPGYRWPGSGLLISLVVRIVRIFVEST